MTQTGGNLALVAFGPTWLQPLWIVGAGALCAVAALYTVYFLLRLAAPKVAAVARTTAKEATSQPLFYVLIAVGVFALAIFPLIPYFTLGEDVKMVKSSGLTLVKVLAIILALWTASTSIAEEIEGRTALTLLSKPIGRRRWILGKFLGIVAPVAVLFIILGAVFLATVSYKVAYDAVENVLPPPTDAECLAAMVSMLPGLALSFLETIVLISISVAISTRLPMIPNLVICVAIYALGHLVPNLVQSSVGEFEIVSFFGQFLATVLPVLGNFSMESAISNDQLVPWTYVGVVVVYCVLYSTASMLVALLLFEDRDLA